MSEVGGGDFGTVLGHYIVVMFKFECKNILFFFLILHCSFCSIMLLYSLCLVTYRESMQVWLLKFDNYVW